MFGLGRWNRSDGCFCVSGGIAFMVIGVIGATLASAQPGAGTGKVDGECQQSAEPLVCFGVNALQRAGYWGFPVERGEVMDLQSVLKEIFGAPDGSKDVETARWMLEDIRGRIPGWIERLSTVPGWVAGLAENAAWSTLRKQCAEDLNRSGGVMDVFEEGLRHLEAGTPFDWEAYEDRVRGETRDCQVAVQRIFKMIWASKVELEGVLVHLRDQIAQQNCNGRPQLARRFAAVNEPLTPCENGNTDPDLARRYTEALENHATVSEHSFDFMKDVFRFMTSWAGHLWFVSSVVRGVGDDLDISFLEELGEEGRELVDRVGVESGIVPEEDVEWRPVTVGDRDWSGVEKAPDPEQVARDDRDMQRVDYENEGRTVVRFYRDRDTNTEFWLYLGDDVDPTVFANDGNTDIQDNNRDIESWADINNMKIEGEVRDGNRIRFRGTGYNARGEDILFTFMEIGSGDNLKYTLTIEE